MIEQLANINPLIATGLGAGSAIFGKMLDGVLRQQAATVVQAQESATAAAVREGASLLRFILVGAAIVVTGLFPFIIALLPDIDTVAEVVRTRGFLGLFRREIIEHIPVDGYLMIAEYRQILTFAAFYGLGVLPFMTRPR